VLDEHLAAKPNEVYQVFKSVVADWFLTSMAIEVLNCSARIIESENPAMKPSNALTIEVFRRRFIKKA
jgi:hypothetical protein